MTTNLLSVIEQQQKALEAVKVLFGHLAKDSTQKDWLDKADAAIAAGKQALEQTQGEAVTCGKGCNCLTHCGDYYEHAGLPKPQATEPAPIGFNGLTQAETEATMSVRGLSEPAPSTAGERSGSEKTWCQYVAGMIGTYLNEPFESDRVKAIAGIIERRLWSLPVPKAAVEWADWNARGMLTKLKCWHRLTEAESDELVALLSAPALPAAAMPVGGLTEMLRKFEEYVGRKSVLHASHMGKAMSDADYETFTRLRDRKIPELRNAILAAARSQPVREPLTLEQIQEIIHAKHFNKAYPLSKSDEVCLDWYRLGLRDGEAAHGITKKGGE